ncbi:MULTISPECIES: nucleotide exchange factor GrpE [unclassified Paludibacterium]|uniref:nucleotide exchange factor GrpE n=1 Tax=unclassified Paludibacterium TaxID=2618429 RepID=UPI001C05759C|nr:nucleotide exchange factor GrpE [Paludibacterium sp. B53371]BEV71993.1 nucleotide exchange factor GrpE [Paludibacterium sp. THUN1379]
MQEKPENVSAEAADAVESTETHTDIISEATAEERIGVLEAELAQVKDQYLRSKADMENLRRRHQEELASAHKYAINKFAMELLSVKDSLEMALADQSGQFDNLKFGVDLTLKQLAGAFEKVQIEEINPLGQPLDPHKHQAISSEDAEAETNTVVRVMQKGYAIADRLLRPAMVVVAK